MSQYAIVHLRHGEVEAVFYSPTPERAHEDAMTYAFRSGLIAPGDAEEAAYVELVLRNTRVLEAIPPLDDKLVIKRVFQIGAATLCPK